MKVGAPVRTEIRNKIGVHGPRRQGCVPENRWTEKIGHIGAVWKQCLEELEVKKAQARAKAHITTIHENDLSPHIPAEGRNPLKRKGEGDSSTKTSSQIYRR